MLEIVRAHYLLNSETNILVVLLSTVSDTSPHSLGCVNIQWFLLKACCPLIHTVQDSAATQHPTHHLCYTVYKFTTLIELYDAPRRQIYWFCLLALHVPHLLGTVTYCCRMVLIQCAWDRGVYSLFRHSKYCHSVFQNRRCCLRLQLRSAGPTLPQSRPTLQKIPLFTGCFQLEYSFLGDTNCLRTYFSSSRFNVTSSPWRGLSNVPAATYFHTRCLLCVPASMRKLQIGCVPSVNIQLHLMRINWR